MWWAVFERDTPQDKWQPWGKPHGSELYATRVYCYGNKIGAVQFEKLEKERVVCCRRLEPTPPLPE